MAQSRVVVLLLLVLCGAYAVKPIEDDAVASINEAINSQMEVAVMNGAKDAQEDFGDMATYLGESKDSKGANMDPWETKTIAAIRGMSQDKLAVSTVTDDELKFATDTEEAKAVLEETQQMTDMKQQDEKKDAAAAITAQLAHAQEELGEATDMNTASAVNLFEESEDLGPMEGGIFIDGMTLKEWERTQPPLLDETAGLIEVAENKEDFAPELLEGSEQDVEAQINEQITDQVGDQLDKLSTKKSAVEDGLDEFAKDTQEAAAAVEDMKATLAVPDISTNEIAAGAKKAAEKEVQVDIKDDTMLGDAQEEHTEATAKLSASDDVSASLARAQKMLLEAQAGMGKN